MDVGNNTENSAADHLILEYCPNIVNMANIQRLTEVRFDRNTSFQKGTGRNRMLIAGSQGPTLLSIPILGGRSHHQLFGETRIDHRLPWKRHHLRSLTSNYGRSPYWEHYQDELMKLYEPEISLLFDWNLHLLAFFARLLCPNTQIKTNGTASFGSGSRLYSIDASQNKLIPAYQQVFATKTGFLNNLSVIDLLLNLGHPRARLYLENLVKTAC
jgi:hypothetical protein